MHGVEGDRDEPFPRVVKWKFEWIPPGWCCEIDRRSFQACGYFLLGFTSSRLSDCCRLGLTLLMPSHLPGDGSL